MDYNQLIWDQYAKNVFRLNFYFISTLEFYDTNNL